MLVNFHTVYHDLVYTPQLKDSQFYLNSQTFNINFYWFQLERNFNTKRYDKLKKDKTQTEIVSISINNQKGV